jgi:hypothetical protein
MSNVFDALQNNSFDIITQTMGYDATWTPLVGGAQVTARVLFKDPTEMHELGMVEYSPVGYMMEYRRGTFDGLFESTRNGYTEEVSVNGIAYYVRDIKSSYDGKTYRAKLDLKNA